MARSCRLCEPESGHQAQLGLDISGCWVSGLACTLVGRSLGPLRTQVSQDILRVNNVPFATAEPELLAVMVTRPNNPKLKLFELFGIEKVKQFTAATAWRPI